MKTDFDISNNNHKEVPCLLSGILNNEMILLVKTKTYSWNVKGLNYDDFQTLFQHQYLKIENAAEEIANRIKSYGYCYMSLMNDLMNGSEVIEYTDDIFDTPDMLFELINDHHLLIKHLQRGADVSKNKYQDDVTSDFLMSLREQHEKMTWMLSTYLE